MNRLRFILKVWIPLAGVITLLSAVIYIAIQQDIRMGSNDPQIQMAEDAATAFAQKQPLETILPTGKIEISHSLAPYMIVFDANGATLGSNALLHGSVPEFPKSVLDYTRQNGEDRVTWQPEPGVRSAIVIVPVAGGQGRVCSCGSFSARIRKKSRFVNRPGCGGLVGNAGGISCTGLIV